MGRRDKEKGCSSEQVQTVRGSRLSVTPLNQSAEYLCLILVDRT